jgi:hypothetical protein
VRQRETLKAARSSYINGLAGVDAMKRQMAHVQTELEAIENTSWFMHALQMAKLKAACKKLKIARDMHLSSATRFELMHDVNEELRRDLLRIQEAINARASTQTQLKTNLAAAAKQFEDQPTSPVIQRQPLVCKQPIPELVAAAEFIIQFHAADIVAKEKARTVRLLAETNETMTALRQRQRSLQEVGINLPRSPVAMSPLSRGRRQGAISGVDELIAQLQLAVEKNATTATHTMAKMCVAALEAIDQRWHIAVMGPWTIAEMVNITWWWWWCPRG